MGSEVQGTGWYNDGPPASGKPTPSPPIIVIDWYSTVDVEKHSASILKENLLIGLPCVGVCTTCRNEVTTVIACNGFCSIVMGLTTATGHQEYEQKPGKEPNDFRSYYRGSKKKKKNTRSLLFEYVVELILRPVRCE